MKWGRDNGLGMVDSRVQILREWEAHSLPLFL